MAIKYFHDLFKMNIKVDTTISVVLLFLKNEYNLYMALEKSNISKIRSLPIIKNPGQTNKKLTEKIYFIINEDTIVLELVKFFYKEGGLSVIFRNKDGLRIPNEIALKQIKDIPSIPSSPRAIENYFDVANSLISSSDYYNTDWVVRVLEKAAYKSKNDFEKWLIIKYLISLFQKNNQLPFKQNLSVINSCFREKEDFLKIYSMLLETNNQNALNFADKFHSEVLGGN